MLNFEIFDSFFVWKMPKRSKNAQVAIKVREGKGFFQFPEPNAYLVLLLQPMEEGGGGQTPLHIYGMIPLPPYPLGGRGRDPPNTNLKTDGFPTHPYP